MPPGTPGCVVCNLPVRTLAELDALMANPLRWPANLWDGSIFVRPQGVMGPRIRRWGALTIGERFLEEQGIEIDMGKLGIHYRSHLTLVGAEPADLIAAGIIEAGGMPVLPERIDPGQLLKLYNKGIAIGIRGLHLLETRVSTMQSEGIDVPLEVIRYMVDSGVKLAMSQAAIKARGKFETPESDEDEGFRAGSEPLPSPRMGDHRIRVVDGEARPLVDRGPADREDFIDRARQQGYEAPVRTRG